MHLLNFRGPRRQGGGEGVIDRGHLKMRGVYSHNCDKLNKTNMLSAKIPRAFILIAKNPVHPLICLCLQDLHINLSQMSTAMSESLFRVIVLSSLAYSYFTCDFEQDAMGKSLLIKQETESFE